MNKSLTAICAFMLACGASGRAAEGPSFEVASVKPSAPQAGPRTGPPMRGGPGTSDPTRITFTGVTLANVISRAYGVQSYQIAGPSWINTEKFDIAAAVPPGTDRAGFSSMLKNLLAERFQLVLHHENREMKGYDLVILAGAPKLRKSVLDETAISDNAKGPAGPPKTDANGFAVLDRPGQMMLMKAGPKGMSAYVTGNAQLLSSLAQMLTGELGRPVTDKTGLMDRFDYNLQFAPDASLAALPTAPDLPPVQDDSVPNVFGAVQRQLGLKLISSRQSVDVLVIDSANKSPAAN